MMKIKFSHLFVTLSILSLLPPSALRTEAKSDRAEKRDARQSSYDEWDKDKKDYQKAATEFYSVAIEAEAARLKLEEEKTKSADRLKAAENAKEEAVRKRDELAGEIEKKKAEIESLNKETPPPTYKQAGEYFNKQQQDRIKAANEALRNLQGEKNTADQSVTDTTAAHEKAKTTETDQNPLVVKAQKDFDQKKASYDTEKTEKAEALSRFRVQAEKANNSASTNQYGDSLRGSIIGGGRQKLKGVREEAGEELDKTIKTLETSALTDAQKVYKKENKSNPPALYQEIEKPVIPEVASVPNPIPVSQADVVSPQDTVVQPGAVAQQGASQCDDVAAQAAISKLLLSKEHQKLFGTMINIAQLKMAYRLANKNPPVTSMEAFLNKGDLERLRNDTAFQGGLKATYEKYGLGEDVDALLNSNLLFDKTKTELKYNYKNSGSLRLDNQGASAAILYLSAVDAKKNTKDELLDFTESDAAAVWALGKFAKEKSNSADRNLLTFSVRVCQMFKANNACAGRSSGLDVGAPNEVKKKLDESQRGFETALSSAYEAMDDNAKLCFKSECEEKPFDIEKLRSALTKAVLNESRSSGSKIDFTRTKGTNGVLELKFK